MLNRSETPRDAGGSSSSRSVFVTMAGVMLLFGLIVGLLFPPFAAHILHIGRAYDKSFWLFSILAGLAVGAANFALVHVIIGREIQVVVDAMQNVNGKVSQAELTGSACASGCGLTVSSNDAIGRVQQAFNAMAKAVMVRLEVETRIRSLQEALSEHAELEHVAKATIEHLMTTCSAPGGVLYIVDGRKSALVASSGLDASKLPKKINDDWGPVSQAIERGETTALSVEQHGLTWATFTTPIGTLTPDTLTIIPLRAEGRTVGVAVMASSTTCLTDVSRQLIEAFRTQAGPHLQNAVLHNKLQEMAAIDELTGVLNRRFGMRRLTEEFSRASRHGSPLSALMFDVDHFKKFNDTYGHDAGDEVLRQVSQAVDGQSRSGDVVFRYGGEEFVMVAAGASMEDAKKLGERVRRIIESTIVPWKHHQLHVTASVGVATLAEVQARTPDKLVSFADEALYAAKEGGRNVVAVRTDSGTDVVTSS